MKDICITVFGDSITYGAWDKENGGWVNRLRMMLENNTDNFYHIFNLGIPGETTTGVNAQFNYEYGYRFHPGFNNILVFAIGINDSLVGFGQNSVSIETFKSNITSLIEKSKKYTNNIVFVGLTRVDGDIIPQEPHPLMSTFINTEIGRYDKELKDICKNQSVKYIDVSKVVDTTELSDGLHPDSVGHQKLADKIYESIIEVI